MNRVDEIKNQISILKEELNQIQLECSHPKSCLKKVSHSSTGNFDPDDNRYWYNYHCSLCDKSWTENK